MIQNFSSEFLAPTKKLRRLSLLVTIDDNPSLSQHGIGKLASLSSAMVSNYVRTLHNEGLISVSGENNRTQTYHLTASGRRELSALLHSYSKEIRKLYGNAHIELVHLSTAATAAETL
jgi:predicted transcriptional regulator